MRFGTDLYTDITYASLLEVAWALVPAWHARQFNVVSAKIDSGRTSVDPFVTPANDYLLHSCLRQTEAIVDVSGPI